MWRNLKQVVIAYEWVNWAFYLAVLCVLLVTAVFIQSILQPIHIARHDFSASNHCEHTISDRTGHAKFIGYVLSQETGKNLCRMLGGAAAFAQYYSSLRFEWSIQAEMRQRQISEKRYDLLAVRPEEMASASPAIRATYREIALYPAYKVFFIARDDQPELTREFIGKRILGLLNDQNSRSGYRIPLDALQRSGLDIREVHFKRYSSHQDLRDALARKEVDLIGTYWDERDRNSFPEWKTLGIGDADRGLSWYVDVSVWQNKEIRCALAEALSNQAKQSNDSYFGEIRISGPAQDGCDGS